MMAKKKTDKKSKQRTNDAAQDKAVVNPQVQAVEETNDSFEAPTSSDKKVQSTELKETNDFCEVPALSNDVEQEYSDAQQGEEKLSLLERIGCKLAERIIENLKKEGEELKAVKKDYEQIKILKNEIEEIHKNLEESSQLKLKAVENARDQYEQNWREEEAKRKRTENDLDGAKKELEQANTNLDNKEAELERTKKDLGEKGQSACFKATEEKAAEILKNINAKFNELNAPSIDLALNGLEKKINNLESKISVLEQAASKSEASRKDTEKRSEEIRQAAEARVSEIEATDSGQLVIQLETLKKELDEKKENLNEDIHVIQQLHDELDCAKGKTAGAEEKLKRRDEDVRKVSEELDNLKNEHSEEVAKLRAESRKAIDEMERRKELEIQGVKETHKAEVERIQKSHKDEVAELKKTHEAHEGELEKRHADELKKMSEQSEADLNSLKKEYADEQLKTELKHKEITDKLEAEIKKHKASMAGLEHTINEESRIMRSVAHGAMADLVRLLSEKDIMSACNDDYKEKADEKLQDLRLEAKQMLSELDSLREARTPSEWKGVLLNYLMDRITDETSLVNRLLKYYTLSNVPFMIDEDRDNGLYFIRRNMKQAYEYISILLAQCGIVPVMPALFVENAEDDNYEVNGQFNDIEAFCPGSINEHVSHVERSSGGLDTIIVGVTKVGYVINGESKIKAQIIIR